MENALKRCFEKGTYVYVVDYWGTNVGTQAFEAAAQILKVDENSKTFTAVLYGDTYQTYSFNDYGRLIFDTPYEAKAAANQLPKPQTTIYQIIGKRIYKKLVLGISGHYSDGAYDLIVRLNKGKDISTKELGHSLFLNKSDAREIKK